MKRVGHLFERLIAFNNLLAAHRLARRGKRGRPAIERFTRRLEPELFRLQDELASGRYQPAGYVTFEVFDPKRRTISVAPFRDRVVHHALIAVIQPHIERGFDPDSFGCRVGKGTDGALARAHELSCRYRFCLKTDIRNFFASIRHDIVEAQLDRRFKDQQLMALVRRIVQSGGAGGRGLPIGNLTSQWLANLYLTPLDQFARAQAQCRGYVRYMDDVLLFGGTGAGLRDLALEQFVGDRLGLELKRSVTQVYRTDSGFPFLGLRVSRRGLAIRRDSWRRLTQRMRRREWEYRRGRIDLDALSRSVGSTLAHLRRAPTTALRRKFLAEHSAVEW